MRKLALAAMAAAASIIVVGGLGMAPAVALAPQNEIGHVDSISFQGGRGIVVTGWELDAGTPADTDGEVDVQVYFNGNSYNDYNFDSRGPAGFFPIDQGQGDVLVSRPDIAATYPGAGPNHGFTVETDAPYGGTYNVCVDVSNEHTGASAQLGCTPITVPAEHIYSSLDSITPGVKGTQPGAYVAGWVDDNYGVVLNSNYLNMNYGPTGAAAAGSIAFNPSIPRPDVTAALPTLVNPQGFRVFVPADPGQTSITACLSSYRALDPNPCITGNWVTPSETTSPAVTGASGVGASATASPGQTLGITPGAWSSPTNTLTDAWTQDPTSTVPLPGGATHLVGLGDIGHTLVAREIAGSTDTGVIANAWSQNVPVSIPGMQPSTRLYGDDRYDVAVAESQDAYPSSALPSTVFVASGENFSDALSAGPVAAKMHAPLLLTQATSLPSEVVTELQRLHPQHIVLVGGPASVAPIIEQQMDTIAPVQRIGGADRYAVSQAVDNLGFTSSAHVWVVTGQNYPDAMSAGVAAAAHGEPVLLVNGSAATTDAATKAELTKLGATSVTVAGGTASVSAGVAASLGTGITVARDAGADRFAVSLNVAADAFPSSGTAYLATGANYPDGLDAAALAGKVSGPLLLLQGDCVPQNLEQELITLHTTNVTLLGGPASLGPDVDRLTACAS